MSGVEQYIVFNACLRWNLCLSETLTLHTFTNTNMRTLTHVATYAANLTIAVKMKELSKKGNNNTCHYGSKQVKCNNISIGKFAFNWLQTEMIRKKRCFGSKTASSHFHRLIIHSIPRIFHLSIPFKLMTFNNTSSAILNPSRVSRTAI